MAIRHAPILTVGEALVDWVSTERGAGLEAAGQWVKAPGGAPMNVAIGLARLGVPVAFAGRVGGDPFGAWLAGLLAEEGVDTRLVRQDPERQTRMAYVVTTRTGERELAAFSTIGVADAALNREDLPDVAIEAARCFYFGSLALRAASSRLAVLSAAQRVRDAGGLVVFDPNFRPVLWPDEAEARAVIDAGLAVSDLVKLGDDEAIFLTGETDPFRAATGLLDTYGLSGVVVTLGPGGALVRTAGVARHAPAWLVTPEDPTGAGDGFVAGLLEGLWRADDGRPMARQLGELPEPAWERLLARATAIGGLATTRPGAIAALPRAAELEAFMRKGVRKP